MPFTPQTQPKDERGRFAAAGGVKGQESDRVSKALENAKGLSVGTRAKVAEALDKGFKSFSKPELTEDDQKVLDRYVAGDTRGQEIIDLVNRGTVLKDVTVYRTSERESLRRGDRVTSFTMRKEWAEQYAKDNDLWMTEVNLKRGDKALFVPYFNTGHVAEVEVLVPPRS